MSDLIDFHDLTVETFSVDASARSVRLTAVDAHAPTAPRSVAEFHAVSVYCLSGDLFGMIVFELEERDPHELYRQFSGQLVAAYTANHGHEPWVASEADARRHITAHGLRGFELSSSTGGAAAVWCRELQLRIEPR